MRCLLPLTAAGVFLAVSAFAAGDVVIPNGDFEDYSGGQFNDWAAVGITGGDPILEEFDTWDGYGAFYADEASAGDHYLYLDIDPEESELVNKETYLLTAKVKARGVAGTGGAGVRVSWPPYTDAQTVTSNLLTGTREWTLVQIPFRAGELDYYEEDYRISVGLFGASGEAWFDDVRIIRINGLLKNPDLERGVEVVPTGWSPSDWTTGAGNAAYEVGGPLTGTRSLEVTAAGGNNYKYQSFDVKAYDQEGYLKSFHDFVLSAYVKADSLSGDGVYLRVNKVGTIENHDSDKISGTKDWTPVSVFFTPEFDYDYETRLVVNGSGTAYFDRVRLDRLVVSDAGFDLGELQDVFGEIPTEGAVPWWKYAGIGNVVQIEMEDRNKFVKLYYNDPSHPPKAYQTVELLKGCDYRITWRGRAAVGAGAYVAVKVGDEELYRRGFSTGPSFEEFEDFFYVPPEDIGNSDSIEAEVTVSLTYDDNTASFDDVFIEKVSERQDVNPVTVIPQPQAVIDLGFDTKPIKTDVQSGANWKIYVTGGVTPPPPGTWGDIAKRLSDDLESEFDIGQLTWSNLTGQVLRPAIVIGDADGANQYFLDLIDDLGGVSDYVTGNDEGYEIFIDRDLIVIAASEEAGAFYGTQTLLHYLKEVPNRSYYPDHDDDRAAYVPCGHVYDWPDMPLRGTMAQIFEQVEVTTEDDNGKLNLEYWAMYQDWIRFLASMKVNALLIVGEYPTLGINPSTEEPYISSRPAGFPPEYGDPQELDIENYEAYRWLFDECRKNFIEPIPHFGPMGTAPGGFLAYCPHGAEGRFIGKIGVVSTPDTPDPKPPEEMNLSDGQWHPVNNKWVIKRKDADEFGSPDAYFKVEKYVNEEWVDATGLPWYDEEGSADYTYEYVDVWFNNYDKSYHLESTKWHDLDTIDGNRNFRIKARDFHGLVRVFYTHVFYEESSKRQSYCPLDPDVIDLYEDTIDEIFDYLNPIEYFGMNHCEVWRMHTCAKCYDAPGTLVGGKGVTACGKLLGDDVDRYYDAITAAAVEHQGGLIPDMLIWADCFSWTSNAISFGLYEYQKNEYRNKYGYPSSETVGLNEIGVDSCRWLLQDHPKLVMHPWEYSINMLSYDGGQDVVPKWTMTQFAREFVEGMPVSVYYGNSPPYWPDPYPKYRLVGCPAAFPERFINYGRGPSKTTKHCYGRGGVYLGLQLLDNGDNVITKTTPAGVTNSEEPILKTGQCIEGSLWHAVEGRDDEWEPHEGVNEDWYYAERNLGKLNKASYYKGDEDKSDQIDYARFRVHFDSYPHDQPNETDVDFDFGAGGKVWCDDTEFRGSTTDWATEFEVSDFNDAYFEHEGTGGEAFTHWDLTKTGEGSEDEIKEYYDEDIFRFVYTDKGESSCRYDRRKALSDEFYHSAVETDVAGFGTYNFDVTKFRVGVRLRAKYVDTYRLGNVWQWQYILDKYDYLKYDPERKTALGIIPYNASRFVFYGQPEVQGWDFNRRHNIHTNVNGRACDAAVAEWCWSLNKPRKWYNPMSLYDVEIYNTPKLENLWYCPYYIHQREKTWFEKK